MRSRAGASTHGGSLGSAAVFPELLPQQVLQFAELPLKPLPACVNSGAPTSPLGPLDHPWLSSGCGLWPFLALPAKIDMYHAQRFNTWMYTTSE